MDMAAQRCCWCWLTKVTEVLQHFGLSHDRLPIPQGDPHRDPIDTLKSIKDAICKAYIQYTGCCPASPHTQAIALLPILPID